MRDGDRHIYQRLGRMLVEARKRRGWTQGRAAAEVGLSRASIANIETGRQSVDVARLLTFMRLYGVRRFDRDALLGRDFL